MATSGSCVDWPHVSPLPSASAADEVALFLKDDRFARDGTRTIVRLDREHGFGRIRCPACDWRPSPASRWSCSCDDGGPEPFFPACGTAWNTFSTRGRCPGCNHQWRWTSCLRCREWSLHDDWYEPGSAGDRT